MIPCNSEFRAYALVRQRYMYVCMYSTAKRYMANAHAKPLRASLRSAQKEKKSARQSACLKHIFVFVIQRTQRACLF